MSRSLTPLLIRAASVAALTKFRDENLQKVNPTIFSQFETLLKKELPQIQSGRISQTFQVQKTNLAFSAKEEDKEQKSELKQENQEFLERISQELYGINIKDILEDHEFRSLSEEERKETAEFFQNFLHHFKQIAFDEMKTPYGSHSKSQIEKPFDAHDVSNATVKMSQCIANSLIRHITNNGGMYISEGGMSEFFKILRNNPKAFYSRFYARVPYNLLGIQPAILIAEEIADGKNPSELSPYRKCSAILAGSFSELVFGSAFEIYSMYGSFFSAKAKSFFAKNGISKTLAEIEDSEFWNIIKKVNNEKALKIYQNPELIEKLKNAGISFEIYEKSTEVDLEKRTKILRKILNNRQAATIIAEETAMGNVVFNSQDSMKALQDKFGEKVKPGAKEFASIFSSSSLFYTLRNMPFYASVYAGLKKEDSSLAQQLSLTALLGAASSLPADAGNTAAIEAAKGTPVFDSMKLGAQSTIQKIQKDPKSIALAMVLRVIANYAALMIFGPKTTKKAVDEIERVINKLNASEKETKTKPQSLSAKASSQEETDEIERLSRSVLSEEEQEAIDLMAQDLIKTEKEKPAQKPNDATARTLKNNEQQRK